MHGSVVVGVLSDVPELVLLAGRRLQARVGLGGTCGVTLLVLDSEGRLLLVKSRHRRQWSPPGGYLRPHEPPLEGVTRELVEETSLVLEAAPTLVSSVTGPGVRHVTHVFVAMLAHLGPVPYTTRSWEIEDLAWFTPNSLPALHPSLAPIIGRTGPTGPPSSRAPGEIQQCVIRPEIGRDRYVVAGNAGLRSRT